MEIVSSRDEREWHGWGQSTSLISHRLLYAVSTNDISWARQLITEGANVNYMADWPQYTNEPCLSAAVCEENLEMVELLLAHGADPNLWDDSGDTPLAKAIYRDSLEIIRCLINYRVDVKSPYGMAGSTPLMDAIGRCEDDTKGDKIVDLLLSHGANPYIKNGSGENFFAYAKRLNKPLPPNLIEESLLARIGSKVHQWLRGT